MLAFRNCYVGISQIRNSLLEDWVRNRYDGVYDELLKHFISRDNDL